MRYIVLLFAFFVFISGEAKIIKASEKLPPAWKVHGEDYMNDLRSNDSYYFKIITDAGSNLQELKQQQKLTLANYIGMTNNISGGAKTEIENDHGESESNTHQFKVKFYNKIGVQIFYATLVHEYWELDDVENMYNYEALFAVSRTPESQQLDDFATSTKYGSAAVVRSLIPGWGQIYKGSKAKGLTIIGAEVAAIGGIIYTENQRSTYESKVNTRGITTNQLKTYKNKMDNFETARNVCIGAAAAIYIYNLVDAAVAPGARRVIVKPRRYAMGPYVTPEGGAGLSLAYTF